MYSVFCHVGVAFNHVRASTSALVACVVFWSPPVGGSVVVDTHAALNPKVSFTLHSTCVGSDGLVSRFLP